MYDPSRTWKFPTFHPSLQARVNGLEFSGPTVHKHHEVGCGNHVTLISGPTYIILRKMRIQRARDEAKTDLFN